MKVLHVLDHSLPNYDGYAFRSREIIRFQRAIGIDTAQMTSPKHEGTFVPEEDVEGVVYYRSRCPRGVFRLPVLDQIGTVRCLAARIREVVAIERPDVLHVHSPSLNGLAAMGVARDTGLPLLYELRSFWEDAAVDAGACREGDFRYRLTRATETRVVRRAARVVPICRGIANDLRSRGVPEDRITVIPNAVDFARFADGLEFDERLAERHGLRRGRTLGYAGSFFAFEGLELLIEAMAEISAGNAAWRLLLIGDGEERKGLEERVSRLGLADRVIFTGRVPHEEITSYYSVIDVLVYPRRRMRLTDLVTPLKPLEAMAYGKVVVASDVGGHRELIEDGQSGMLFEADQPSALVAAVRRLESDDRLRERLSTAGRVHVRKRHNWHANIRQYEKLYAELVL